MAMGIVKCICTWCRKEVTLDENSYSHLFSKCPYCKNEYCLNEIVSYGEDGKICITKEKELFSFSNQAFNVYSLSVPYDVKKIGRGAFENNRFLSIVHLPEGLEEIDSSAFYGCEKLSYVSLPRSLHTIKSGAFSLRKRCLVSVPSNLTELDTQSFGLNPFLLVHKNSYGERFAKENDFDYLLMENTASFVTTNGIKDDVLYFFNDDGANVRIPNEVRIIEKHAFSETHRYHTDKTNYYRTVLFGENVEIIKEKAFYDCYQLENVSLNEGLTEIGDYAFANSNGNGKIKKLVIPSSVRKIGEGAFAGQNIEELVFSDGVEQIESRAFSDCVVAVIKLPESIKYFADDAFYPDSCVIVGDKPREAFLLQKKNEQQKTRIHERISCLKTEIERRQKVITALKSRERDLEEQIAAREKDISSAALDVDQRLDSLHEIRAKYESKISECQSEIQRCNEEISNLQKEIEKLNEELGNVFFLAVSKKKSLVSEINNRETRIKELNEGLDSLNKKISEFQTEIENQNKLFADAQKRHKDLLSLSERDQSEIKAGEETIRRNQEFIHSSEDEIIHLEEELSSIKDSFQAEIEKIIDDLPQRIVKAENALQRKKLFLEKQSLERILQKPDISNVRIPEYYVHVNSIPEEKELNEALVKALPERVVFDFVNDHSNEIKRLKEINTQLGLDEYDGFSWAKESVKSFDSFLPERVLMLCDFFCKLETWQDMMLWKGDQNNTNRNNLFFASVSHFEWNPFILYNRFLDFRDKDNVPKSAIFLPYCIILFSEWSGIEIYNYYNSTVSIEISEKEYQKKTLTWKGPEFGELLSKHYLHQNADGTPNMRYKDNPVVYHYRNTKLCFQFQNLEKSIKVNVESAALAEKFIQLYNAHKDALSDGECKEVYEAILRFADLADIRELIKSVQKQREIRLQEELEATEELKKLAEQQRVAKLKEEEERRLALIEEQKRRNEERKRIEAEKKRRVEKIHDLFSDESVDMHPKKDHEGINEKTDESIGPFIVQGKKDITNNVFKLTLVQTEHLDIDSIKVCFVDNNGNAISNEKHVAIGEVNTETSLGFILKSGIDFTSMKECSMQFFTTQKIYEKIEFKMNISFFSDF